jgi:spore germination protein KB
MEKGKISAFQMGIMMYHAIIPTAILSVPGLTAKYAKSDMWLSPIWASIIGFMIVIIVIRLYKLFPEKTFFQMCEQAVGKWAGKLLGFSYFCLFIMFTGNITRIYAEFLIGLFFPKTPISVVIISMLVLSAVTVRGGLEVVARCSQIIFPVFFFSIFIIILLLVPHFELGNLLPIMENGVVPSLKGAVVPQEWFGEFFLMLFFLPYLTDAKHGKKWGLSAVFVVLITFVTTNLTVLFILGSEFSTAYPFLTTARLVNIANFFDNLDAIIMSMWILGLFVKITVFYYVMALSTAQWLHLSDFKPIVWPLGILILELSFWSLPNTLVVNHIDLVSLPFWGFLMYFLIPLLILGIASLRKKQT